MDWGHYTLLIERLLHYNGPMTRSEIFAEMSIPSDGKGAILSRMCKPTPKHPIPRIHVCGYKHEADGAREYPRPVYAPGPAPEGLVVKRPKPIPAKEVMRRRRARLQSAAQKEAPAV